jgi:hypothetical protein
MYDFNKMPAAKKIEVKMLSNRQQVGDMENAVKICNAFQVFNTTLCPTCLSSQLTVIKYFKEMDIS